MLKLINEELMSYSTLDITDKNTGRSYTKIKVVTSNKLQQYENDRRYNGRSRYAPREEPQKKVETPRCGIVSHVDKVAPINREVIRISAPLKNMGDFLAQPNESRTVNFDMPMSLNVNSTNKYQPSVEIRCHDQGDDRANVYVVAFPFNGMIRPIPENPQYRIYKGLIASSVKPFFFNNRKYRKVLYLVIEVNKNLFNSDHKYHTDCVDIQLESYALFDDRETGEKKTNCEVFKLSVKSATGDYEVNWNYRIADEAIMMNAEPGQQLWTTYSFENSQRPQKPVGPYNKKKYQKPVSVEGDMLVTVNKHGIRKETSIKQNRNRNPRGPRKNTPDGSLDRMMQNSGMYERDYENNDRNRRNNGKKNKKGNRYDQY